MGYNYRGGIGEEGRITKGIKFQDGSFQPGPALQCECNNIMLHEDC